MTVNANACHSLLFRPPLRKPRGSQPRQRQFLDSARQPAVADVSVMKLFVAFSAAEWVEPDYCPFH
jgi:hypothetical protein